MKAIKKLLVCAGMFALTACSSTLPATTQAEPPVGVSFQFFYDNLSPYGTWVSYPSYGYVWMPRVAPGFRPYFSSGNWVHTYNGWMWVSLYDWGWAPFHYGSWMYDPFYGWLWVPGYHWAPAWVTWGYYSGYYGWAPVGPGVPFSASYYPPMDYWVFVPPSYVTNPGWNNSYYTVYNNRITFDNNTSITNVRNIDIVDNAGTYEGQRFNAGPTASQYERLTNTKVNTVAVKEANAPSKTRLTENNVSIYRPNVDASDKSTARPSKVTPLETMKRSAGDETRTREGKAEQKTAPEIRRERVPERGAPDVRERSPERTAPVQREQPRMQERKQDTDRSAPKRESVPPRTKEQPNARPAPPQRNIEPPRQERTRQAPPERIERSQPEPQPRVAPESERPQQIERLPREPRYQPQPQPQQRERGGRSPK